MTTPSPPFEERRHTDQAYKYRMDYMERELADTKEQLRGLHSSVEELKNSQTHEFAELRKTLFERPIFVTYEILKLETENLTRQIAELRKSDSNSISTARFYVSLALTALVAIGSMAISLAAIYYGR